MKTKIVLVSVLFILSSVLGVNALYSAEPTNSATTTLNIKLNPIQTITVGQPSVDLLYATTENYLDGVSSKKQVGHLTVFSTGGFIVNVNSVDEFFQNPTNNSAEPIAVSDVTVKATKGEVSYEAQLSKTGTELISSDTGGNSLKYDVVYDNTAGAGKYLVSHFDKNAGAAQNIFTTTVTYTIAAK